MTALQQQIIIHLFNGSHIIKLAHNNYRVRDGCGHSLRGFKDKTFDALKKYLRKNKHTWLLDLNKVRQTRGNSAIKKYYQTKNKKQ